MSLTSSCMHSSVLYAARRQVQRISTVPLMLHPALREGMYLHSRLEKFKELQFRELAESPTEQERAEMEQQHLAAFAAGQGGLPGMGEGERRGPLLQEIQASLAATSQARRCLMQLLRLWKESL